MPASVIQFTTSFTRAILSDSTRPSDENVSHATGTRTVLNPRRASAWTYSFVMSGLPQPVSQLVVLSSVLPILMPGLISEAAVHASMSAIFSKAGGVAVADETAAAMVLGDLGGGRKQASGPRTAKNRKTVDKGEKRRDARMMAKPSTKVRLGIPDRSRRSCATWQQMQYAVAHVCEANCHRGARPSPPRSGTASQNDHVSNIQTLLVGAGASCFKIVDTSSPITIW